MHLFVVGYLIVTIDNCLIIVIISDDLLCSFSPSEWFSHICA